MVEIQRQRFLYVFVALFLVDAHCFIMSYIILFHFDVSVLQCYRLR